MLRLFRTFGFVHRELFTNMFPPDRVRVVLFRSFCSRNKAPDKVTSNNFDWADAGPPGGAATRPRVHWYQQLVQFRLIGSDQL